MAKDCFHRPTCIQKPGGYDSPTNHGTHPGVTFHNEQGKLGTGQYSILDGPQECNGTYFIDCIHLWNNQPVGPKTDPITVTFRLVTVPKCQYINDNTYRHDYYGEPCDDFVSFTICPCESRCWDCCPVFYLKGNQRLVAYASEPDTVNYLIMYRKEM